MLIQRRAGQIAFAVTHDLGAGDNSCSRHSRLYRQGARQDRARVLIYALWVRRGSLNRNRASQPTADCLCFCGFRAIDAFTGTRESEKRGGAGPISEMGGCDSANRVAGESRNVRTTSEDDMGDDCRDLWWSSIHRASKASDVSWIHWSIKAAISSRKFAA